MQVRPEKVHFLRKLSAWRRRLLPLCHVIQMEVWISPSLFEIVIFKSNQS